jgi:hypothetical protein
MKKSVQNSGTTVTYKRVSLNFGRVSQILAENPPSSPDLNSPTLVKIRLHWFSWRRSSKLDLSHQKLLDLAIYPSLAVDNHGI